MKKFHTLTESKQAIANLYETGITRGVYLGFPGLDEYFTLKPSGTTYLYGSPFSGKTEFWFEILLNLSEFYGWRHAIYSPESGTVEEIYAELISKYLRKPFYRNHTGHMSEAERFKAEDFVGEYFYVIDPGDEDLDIEGFYYTVQQIEREMEVKINTTCCDPFNELKHFFEDGRQDLYIENKLGYIRREALANTRHNVIITHCRDQQAITKDNKRYFPPASPREIAGGQAWYRKAMNLLCIWRPPHGMQDDTGREYSDNEVHVIVNKYKPKGVGRRGTARLFYDIKTNRYYEMQGDTQVYAGKKRPEPTDQRSINYMEPNKKEEYEF